MASKYRTKFPESKLIIEATKPCKLIPQDIIIERAISKNIMTSSKQSSVLQIYPLPLTSHSPQQQDLLASILAKHTIRSKNSENTPKLHNRPKTVSNLKNKKEMNINQNEPNEKINENAVTDSLPKFFGSNQKKEIEYLGDYELGNEIGKGSFAVVKIGTHKSTGEKVAIKIYEKSSLLRPSRKKSVEREIKILTKLKHPNIIKLITTIETPNSINLVQEYINGCSLLDYLKNRSSRKIEENQAKNIFKQILHALDFCHSLGVTHRDIKLENILLDDRHQVKLIDFGFSTFISVTKKVQLFCGTLSYMSPEIVSNKESFGPPTDIWAAGVLLYVLLTGTFPFRANQTKELYSKIQRGIFFQPSGVTTEVKNIFTRVFENDPCKRPTAKEILEDPWISNMIERGNSINIRNFSTITPIFNKTFC